MPQSADPDPDPSSESEEDSIVSDMDLCSVDDGDRESLPLVFACPLSVPLLL